MSNEKLERLVNSTTDVQEACQLGWKAGYDEGYKAALEDLERKLKEDKNV